MPTAVLVRHQIASFFQKTTYFGNECAVDGFGVGAPVDAKEPAFLRIIVDEGLCLFVVSPESLLDGLLSIVIAV